MSEEKYITMDSKEPFIIYNDYWSKMREKDIEIKRLNNIIKEALILTENTRFEEQYASDEILLPILNKLRESGIRNYIKVEGSDKE